MIDQPGVYDLPAAAYHADPVEGGSLSSTGARKLLPPSCPALYHWWVEHDEVHTAKFDMGKAAHRVVLGAGADLVEVEADNWTTKPAREKRDKAYAAGKIPVLSRTYGEIQEMAEVLRGHPLASTLLSLGSAERTLVWVDPPTGVRCRAMLDWLPDPAVYGQMVIVDYKTTDSCDTDFLERQIHTIGYHQQAAWYEAGARALDLGQDPEVALIFQMRTPPYLVRVVQLSALARRIAVERNREALEIYARCCQTDVWPGFTLPAEQWDPGRADQLGLPLYIENAYLRGMQ
jgi:hypothetical protein